MHFRNIINQIGTRLLPYTNVRVVGPPGKPISNGRPNILIVTPRRSGTHVLIDQILNNLPKYRRRPLYIDLDQAWKQRHHNRDLITELSTDAGYVIKSHMPIENGPDPSDPVIAALIENAIVVTVRRHSTEIVLSLRKWYKNEPEDQDIKLGQQISDFWSFWGYQKRIELVFEDLFDQSCMKNFLTLLGEQTGAIPTRHFTGPVARDRPYTIYFNKMMTRIAGRHAPRIDTTIHTLKD